MIGLGQPGLTYFEPAFADELAEVMRWGFEHMQAADGGSVYLRLSTRPLEQPERAMTDSLAAGIVAGAYWREPPRADADRVIVYTGAPAPEAEEAHRRLSADRPGSGLLAVTSADRLFQAWRREGEGSPIFRMLAGLARGTRLVTVLDGHPGALAWLGAVAGHPVVPLGVDRFGQCGSVESLYREYGLDAGTILGAAEG